MRKQRIQCIRKSCLAVESVGGEGGKIKFDCNIWFWSLTLSTMYIQIIKYRCIWNFCHENSSQNWTFNSVLAVLQFSTNPFLPRHKLRAEVVKMTSKWYFYEKFSLHDNSHSGCLHRAVIQTIHSILRQFKQTSDKRRRWRRRRWWWKKFHVRVKNKKILYHKKCVCVCLYACECVWAFFSRSFKWNGWINIWHKK